MSFQDGRRYVELVRRLIAAVIDQPGHPRHRSQHAGGLCSTACVLTEHVGAKISRVGDVTG